MLPDVLGILITSKCNIICRHCCNESHPKATTVMSFSDIDKLIEEAGKSQNFREIGISGGEPFLFLDLLYNICNSAAKRKLSCSVTTNAFWARSNDSAVKILGQLKSAGLSALNVSTSIFHQEFINLSKVTTAVRAALELNLAARVNYVANSASEVEFALREKLGDLTDHIKIEVMPCLPVGRGGNSMSKEEILQVRE
jgi:MoaA/NifB/PqqE/SkfB family radical SAM enzyme